MKITRTLFIFRDGNNQLVKLNNTFFPLSHFLNRLLNQFYGGKKIMFINIRFLTNQYYKNFPKVPRMSAYYYGGHLQYYGLFNLVEFEKMSFNKQKIFVWEKAYEYIKNSSISVKNEALYEACMYANKLGHERDLNPDYRVVETEIEHNNIKYILAVWINFKITGMFSKFAVEKNGIIIYEKHLDSTKLGIGFFLEIYKKINFNGKEIKIIGHKEVKYLPMTISIDDIV